MNLQELIKEHDLKEGDLVVCTEANGYGFPLNQEMPLVPLNVSLGIQSRGSLYRGMGAHFETSKFQPKPFDLIYFTSLVKQPYVALYHSKTVSVVLNTNSGHKIDPWDKRATKVLRWNGEYKYELSKLINSTFSVTADIPQGFSVVWEKEPELTKEQLEIQSIKEEQEKLATRLAELLP